MENILPAVELYDRIPRIGEIQDRKDSGLVSSSAYIGGNDGPGANGGSKSRRQRVAWLVDRCIRATFHKKDFCIGSSSYDTLPRIDGRERVQVARPPFQVAHPPFVQNSEDEISTNLEDEVWLSRCHS